MRTEALLRQTRMHFPRFNVDEIKITPIEKGGSDRKFYRVRCSADQTLILVKYNLERQENRHYVEIAKFLETHGICAPKIYFHDSDEGLIWVEDLGENDLFGYRDEGWLVRRAFYESALDEIAKLHRLPESVCVEMRDHLPAEFNEALYLWEQSYFFENCLGRYFKMDEAAIAGVAASPRLREIAQTLDRRPRVLVHRDFQSQNILIRNRQAYLIDFQGMRPGLAEYDLASLLYDPYVVDLWRGGGDEARRRRIARWATVGWGLVLLGIGIAAGRVHSVLEAGLSIGSIPAGALLGVFLLGVLTNRPREKAAVAGVAAGLITIVLVIWRTSIAFTWYVLIGTATTRGRAGAGARRPDALPPLGARAAAAGLRRGSSWFGSE